MPLLYSKDIPIKVHVYTSSHLEELTYIPLICTELDILFYSYHENTLTIQNCQVSVPERKIQDGP